MSSYPTYLMFGQEAFLGDVEETWLTENKDDRWDDAEASIDIWHHDSAVVDTYDTTPGSAVSNTQVAGDLTKIALDSSMARYLLDVQHPTGMALIKRTDQGTVGDYGSNRWAKTHSESYANIATAYNGVNTLITGRGDTMDVKGIFLCVGYAEGVAADTTLDGTFYDDLVQFVLDLRTDYASSITPVVFDYPPLTFTSASPSQEASLVNARNMIKKLCANDPYASYVDSDRLERSNGSTKWFYTGEATIAQGTAMGEEMARMVTGKASASGTGAPVYVVIGDTQCVGITPSTYLTDGGDEDYAGSQDSVKTWNWASNTWVNLSGSNSNSSTDGGSKFGPDISLGAQLSSRHPNDTVYIFKLGRDDSSISDPDAAGESWIGYNGQIYSEVEAKWAIAKAALSSVESVVADVRGLVIMFSGEDETSAQDRTDGYLTDMRTVITDYRGLFVTRVDETLPVILVKPQDTGSLDGDRILKVRQLAEVIADEDPLVTAVSIDTLRTASDGVHLSGHGALEAGREVGQAF